MNVMKYYHPWLFVCLRQWSLNTRSNFVRKFHQRKIHAILPNTLTISFGLGFWPVSNSQSTESNNFFVNKLSQLVVEADNLFDNGYYDESYLILYECKEEDVEIQWRICRALYNMSKLSKYDKDQKRDFILQAYNLISTLLNSTENNNFAVQKWYAILLDVKSSQEGIKERIKQLENVKKHMDLAVTLNPTDATTLHMLGEWCYQISDMPWYQRKIAETLFASPPQSTFEDALEYFLRAEAAQPRFYSLNLLRLGACYLKLDKQDQAKYYLKLAASYPAKSNDDHLANKEAAELLKKIK